jgi:hypothetical protein
MRPASPVIELDPAMKKLLLIGVSLLAACSSPRAPDTDAAGGALIFFRSQHPIAGISSCLQRRLPSTRAASAHGATELNANGAWLITLTPSPSGSIVAVRPGGSPGRIPEPEMRFAVARCST